MNPERILAAERAQETTFERSTIQKIRRRIHLPKDLLDYVHEERFIMDKSKGENIDAFLANYTYKNGWSISWLDLPAVVKQADAVEVILRRHRSGKTILFRVWKK